MKYKLLVTDYDGTLLSRDGTIHDDVKDAIVRFSEAGGIVAVNTGRMAQSIRRELTVQGALDIVGEYIGSYNGALVTDKRGRWIDKRMMSVDNSLYILDKLRGYEDVFVQAYANDCVYLEDRLSNEATTTYYKACKVLPIIVSSLEDMIRLNSWELFKIVAFTYPKISYGLCDELSSKYGDSYKFTTSGPAFVELNDLLAGKGIGLEMLAKAYGIPLSETVAIGDGGNDVEMFRYASVGVAVDNARDVVKNQADITVCSCDEGAVGRLIDMIMEDKI